MSSDVPIHGLLQMKLDAPHGELRPDLYRVADIFVHGVAP
jgi:hypothetical protein